MAIIEYANTPHTCHIDPTYFPMKCRYSQTTFESLVYKYHDYLNYPTLPTVDKFLTHSYFTSTLNYAICMYEGVLDLVF